MTRAMFYQKGAGAGQTPHRGLFHGSRQRARRTAKTTSWSTGRAVRGKRATIASEDCLACNRARLKMVDEAADGWLLTEAGASSDGDAG